MPPTASVIDNTLGMLTGHLFGGPDRWHPWECVGYEREGTAWATSHGKRISGGAAFVECPEAQKFIYNVNASNETEESHTD